MRPEKHCQSSPDSLLFISHRNIAAQSPVLRSCQSLFALMMLSERGAVEPESYVAPQYRDIVQREEEALQVFDAALRIFRRCLHPEVALCAFVFSEYIHTAVQTGSMLGRSRTAPSFSSELRAVPNVNPHNLRFNVLNPHGLI